MICKNCGNNTDGNYCNNCGQKTGVGRLNITYVISEITGSIFQLQHGFFYTLKELFRAPSKSITEFLEGKRKKYFRPISYLFLTSTVYFLVTLAIDEKTWIGDFISGWIDGGRETDAAAESILIWFSEKYAYTALLLLPIFSFASYLSFSKFNKNYVEHIVINSFITGQQALIYLSFTLVDLVLESKYWEMASLFVSVSYNLFVYYKIFNKGNRVINILRTVMTYIIYLIISVGMMILVMQVSNY